MPFMMKEQSKFAVQPSRASLADLDSVTITVDEEDGGSHCPLHEDDEPSIEQITEYTPANE